MACGAPELQAPKLMSHDEKGHCFFARQPSTAQETDAAIRGTWASCCGAIRYSGRHRETLLRLAEMGLAEQCDSRLEDEPKPVMRNHVSFEFTETDTVSSTTDKSRAITGYLTGWLAKPGRGAVQKLRLSGVQFLVSLPMGRQHAIRAVLCSLCLGTTPRTVLAASLAERGWSIECGVRDQHS
jgi:hypothetical protein